MIKLKEIICIKCKQPHGDRNFKVCIECREEQKTKRRPDRVREVYAHDLSQFNRVMRDALRDGIIRKEED